MLNDPVLGLMSLPCFFSFARCLSISNTETRRRPTTTAHKQCSILFATHKSCHYIWITEQIILRVVNQRRLRSCSIHDSVCVLHSSELCSCSGFCLLTAIELAEPFVNRPTADDCATRTGFENTFVFGQATICESSERPDGVLR